MFSREDEEDSSLGTTRNKFEKVEYVSRAQVHHGQGSFNRTVSLWLTALKDIFVREAPQDRRLSHTLSLDEINLCFADVSQIHFIHNGKTSTSLT